jgi:hypothetical protein
MRIVRQIFLAMVAVGSYASATASAQTLHNPGFELLESTSGPFPNTTENWQGNYSEVVTAENGIIPVDGGHMLKHLGTSTWGGGGAGSTVVQLVAGPSISPGATAVASAWFNRVAAPSESVDKRFDMVIRAHSGTPDTYGLENFIAESDSILISDSNPATWELATASLTLPALTTYVAVIVVAVEDVTDDRDFPEFHGHYVDGVSFAVPEPTTFSLTIVALLFVCHVSRSHLLKRCRQ